MKKFIIPILILVCILFSQCKKDEDNFEYCTGCPISSWVGFYGGTGVYYTVASGESTDGVEVNVTIENPYDSTLKVTVDAPSYISGTFSKPKNDDNHYVLFGSGSNTLDLGLKKKGNEYQLDGTLKKNSWNKIDSIWVVNQSLTFQLKKTAH